MAHLVHPSFSSSWSQVVCLLLHSVDVCRSLGSVWLFPLVWFAGCTFSVALCYHSIDNLVVQILDKRQLETFQGRIRVWKDSREKTQRHMTSIGRLVTALSAHHLEHLPESPPLHLPSRTNKFHSSVILVRKNFVSLLLLMVKIFTHKHLFEYSMIIFLLL